MWKRVKTYFTTNDPMRAVQFLACGFAFLFVAVVGLGITHVHSAKQAREKSAHLLAADLLRLRDAAGDSKETDLYGELIRVRIGEFLSEEDSRSFSELLQEPTAGPMLTAAGNDIEAALSGGELSAKQLRRILADALRTAQADAPLAMASDAASAEAPATSFLPRVDPVQVAERFFGVRDLFQGAVSADTSVTVAYCENVYAVFDSRTGLMTEYVVECNPGAPVLSDGECVQTAVDYATRSQGLYVLSPGEAIASQGIYFVRLSCKGSADALIGVRQDTGRICLFWRTLGK